MKLTVDSPIIQGGIKVTNLLLLNLYFLLGCIPIVTIGASATAAFTVALKITEQREEPGITRAFWRAWVANLKHGILLTVLAFAVVYSVWIDWQLFENTEENPIGFLLLAVFAIFLLAVHYIYIFPLEARYENRLLLALTNSRKLCGRFPLRTLGLVGILTVQFLLFTQTAAVLTYIGIFCCPILMIYTTSQMIMPIFRKLEKDNRASDGMNLSGDNNGFSGI